MKRLLPLILAAAPAFAQISQQPATAVVPVVSSTHGEAGSNFRTGIQMANPTEKTMSGWLLLHPQNVAVQYELAPHATLTWTDFVADVGAAGAGSLDLLVGEGELPTVVVRSYDDQPSGTNGVTVPLVPVDLLLRSGDVAALVTPADPAHFRFNVGVRAMQDGASIEFVLRDSSGSERTRRTVDYAAHQFAQQPADVLLGTAPGPSDSIEVTFLSGAGVVYGSSVDNRTNDASLQVLRR